MRSVFVLFALLLVTGLCYAETTGGADYNTDLGCFNDVRDYVAGHDHEYSQYTPDYEAGIGVDLVVYEADAERTGLKKAIPDVVTVEQKYDIANDNGSTYVVATYNLWDLFKKEK